MAAATAAAAERAGDAGQERWVSIVRPSLKLSRRGSQSITAMVTECDGSVAAGEAFFSTEAHNPYLMDDDPEIPGVPAAPTSAVAAAAAFAAVRPASLLALTIWVALADAHARNRPMESSKTIVDCARLPEASPLKQLYCSCEAVRVPLCCRLRTAMNASVNRHYGHTNACCIQGAMQPSPLPHCLPQGAAAAADAGYRGYRGAPPVCLPVQLRLLQPVLCWRWSVTGSTVDAER